MTAASTITVLCVDPEEDKREGLLATFRARSDFTPVGAGDLASARETAAATAIDCVVSEYELPDGDGFEVFEAVRARHPNAACVLFTSADHGDIDSEAFRDTVAEYLPKGGPDVRDRLADLVRDTVVNRTQVGFPVPPDEDERLDALAQYDVEGLSAVESFDRLSELVARHFGVSVCFVGLVDEAEEKFLACHGADWETLTREDSICTYSIVQDGVTVVENVQEDPRFAHNETLKELDIRSYAGADLTTPEGTVVGELCLIHDEPRGYTDEELSTLRLYAEEVSEQLELRRRLAVAEGESALAGESDR